MRNIPASASHLFAPVTCMMVSSCSGEERRASDAFLKMLVSMQFLATHPEVMPPRVGAGSPELCPRRFRMSRSHALSLLPRRGLQSLGNGNGVENIAIDGLHGLFGLDDGAGGEAQLGEGQSITQFRAHLRLLRRRQPVFYRQHIHKLPHAQPVLFALTLQRRL